MRDWSRRRFLGALGAAGASCVAPLAAQQAPSRTLLPRGPKPFEFVFARLRYDSGDWDYNPKVAANVLDAVIQYTEIPVYPQEIVIGADSRELAAFPFLFMTGHKLVRFSQAERDSLVRYVEAGGVLFSDDCNHDVDGLYAQSFEAEMRRTFPGEATLAKIPNTHVLYRCFFRFPEGPPQTGHELNGWGDDVVHDYLRGVERHGRLGVIYSNKDYGCEWDYDWRNKRFRREDNTRFAVNLAVYAMT
ncbi:MAG: DUF4159 domain-containing protein [Vicinamibacterales bacterium]